MIMHTPKNHIQNPLFLAVRYYCNVSSMNYNYL